MSKTWPKVRLGDVLRQTNSRVTVSAEAEYPNFGIFSYGRGLFRKLPISGSKTSATVLYRARAGQFVYSRLFAFEGAYGVVPREFDGYYVSNEFPLFDCVPSKVLPEFLARYLSIPSVWKRVAEASVGVGHRRQRVQPQGLLAHELNLPSLAEQGRVVLELEELSSTIQEARILRRDAEAEVAVISNRAITTLLDDRGWETKSLGELLNGSPRNGLSPKPEVESGGRPMLRISSVSSSPTRYVDLSAAKMVDTTDKEAEQFTLRQDDVFIVRYNGDINRVAKPAIYKASGECRAVFPDKLMRLRVDSSKMLPDFLVFALSARSVRKQVEELGKTTAGNIGISGSDAKSFTVPVPPLNEQYRIIGELDALQTEVDELKRLQSETAAELDAMLLALLDRAFQQPP